MRFAVFFGDGSLNAKDGTNLISGASGGTTFAPIGSGPVNAPNYATITPTSASLSTGMADAIPGWSLVWCCQAPQSGSFAQIMRNQGAAAGITWNAPTGPTVNASLGGTAQGAGAQPPLTNRPAFGTWRLYGITSSTADKVHLVDLTVGETTLSPSNPTTTSRPWATVWEIGATTPQGGYTNPWRIAFAAGAHYAMTPAELTAFAASIRPMLAQRGVVA